MLLILLSLAQVEQRAIEVLLILIEVCCCLPYTEAVIQ